MITLWAALESMACRLITERASDEDIASLRKIFTSFENGHVQAHIDEYSARNIAFHQNILELSGCGLLKETADRLFLHMTGIRARTISELDRPTPSIIDHLPTNHSLEAANPHSPLPPPGATIPTLATTILPNAGYAPTEDTI